MSMQLIKRGLAVLALMGLALPALAETTVSDAGCVPVCRTSNPPVPS